MAKINKAISFENAQICLQDGTITEYIKDGTNVYQIMDILKEWDGIDGINLILKQSNSVLPQRGCFMDMEDLNCE